MMITQEWRTRKTLVGVVSTLKPRQLHGLTQSRETSTGVRARTPIAARICWRSRDRNGGLGATISERL
jgi:hypothetical protein